jgi:hypothetical protein
MRTLAFACAIFLGAPAGAEPRHDPGILRARDLTLFGLQRLDMRPTDMSDRQIGQWTVELQTAYQNTFAMSDDVRGYLQRRETGRMPLRTADAQALLSAPHDAYYVDVEVGMLDLILQRQFTRHLAAFFELPYIHFGKDKLDSLVEGFHDAVGLGQMGRDLVARDRFQIVYRLADSRLQMLDREVDGGFADPIVGLRYMPSGIGPWQFAIEAAAKLPVGGERALLSTGETDLGLQASTRRRFGRTTVQASATVVHYSGGLESPSDELIPTLILACSYAATPDTSLILQSYASRSAVRGTSIDELNDNKYQMSLGLQSSLQSWIWTFAITENIANFNNTPDVGFQFGLSYTGRH